ncbi:MAG: FHA domain-containing protein [Chitinivibrionales bacterium]|nr:FHA domain-containing protein [Chitinivibrionales bacterium]
MPRFSLLYNNKPIKSYDISEPVITIGRLPENTISITNMGVSRRHARIEASADNSYIISDLNSLNGTFVNNKMITKSELAEGDRILIGKYAIIFEGNSPQAAAESSQSIEETNVLEQQPEALPPEEEATPEQQPGGTSTDEIMPPDNRDDEELVLELDDENPDDDRDTMATESDKIQEAITHPVLIETNKHVVHKLDKDYITLGNSENDDIFIDGLFIDESHVAIEKRDGDFWLLCKKLLGKISVNGKKVKSHCLQHKDRIEIGSSTLRFMENQ